MVKNLEKFVSPLTMEEEETLSFDRLKSLTLLPIAQDLVKVNAARPKDSFIDLMDWVYNNFSDALKNKSNLNKFVHNRVLVDGQFIKFCEEKKVKIRALYKDSIVSWKTDNNFEKFFVQGIFLISYGNLEFLHSALYHKGNQFEDEISFFTIVSETNYQAYLDLRNDFDSWVTKRDRSNLHIRVVDGEDTPYSKDNSWDDVFLTEEMKKDIRQCVENFLNNKDFYLENNIPWKTGMLIYGDPGNGKSTLIKTIISNYNFKPVTIIPGANDDAVREAFAYAEEQSPSLLFFEDLDSMLDRTIDTSSFLNLMDGVSAKNGIFVIATANDISKFKGNIIDRPSRFDKKFEIPLPDAQMAYQYMKKWFNNLIPVAKLKELAKHAVKYKFSYAYLKELYISSMFEALSNNRKVPADKDIAKALDRLMKDKNILKSGRAVNTERYFNK